MNNKKKINIVLIIAVSGLWSTVLFKYVNRFFYVNDLNQPSKIAMNAKLPEKIKKDTFDLKPLANDPFLGRSYVRPVVKARAMYYGKPKAVVKVPLQSKPKTIVSFPVVKYFGFIKSRDKKDEMILIKVGSSLHKTRLNENCDGVIVKKIYRDSVQVVFGKEVKTIKR